MVEISTEHIPANMLDIDPGVQRGVSVPRVKKIAEAWNSNMVGTLTVSRRVDPLKEKDDRLVVLDGQTRLLAFREVCGENTTAEMRCDVYSGLARKEEAEVFLSHNDRRSVLPRDRYRLECVAGTPWATALKEVAGRHGWRVAGSPKEDGDRQFSAVVAAQHVYELDKGETLELVFAIIAQAWGKQHGAVCSETLYGLGWFFAHHELTPSQVESTITKLSKIRLHDYVGDIKSERRRTGRTTCAAAYKYVLSIYNHGRAHSQRIDG